jgi:hypothetical protein
MARVYAPFWDIADNVWQQNASQAGVKPKFAIVGEASIDAKISA